MESLNKQQIEFLKEQITDLKREMTAGFALINAKLELMNDGYVKKEDFATHCSDAKDLYATKEEVKPIRTVVYGAVGIVLVAVFSALVYLVVKQ